MPDEITSPIYTGDPLAPGDITRGTGLFGGQGGLQNQLEMEGTDASALYEAVKIKEWDDLKEAYENDEATLLDLRNFDPGVLSNNETWMKTYNDFVTEESVLDKETADIRQILKDNGYSDEAIEEIFKAEVNSTTGSGLFEGNNVLSNALCEIGYSNCSDWSVKPIKSTGPAIGSGCTDSNQRTGTIDENGDCQFTVGGECKKGSVPGTTDVSGECVTDNGTGDGNGGYSEEEQSTAEAVKDWIEGQIGKVKDMTVDDVLEVVFGGNAFDPKCELTGEGEEMWDCTGTDGTEGNQCWKDCVSVSVLGGIPGLPMPPGNIDVGTVRDLENTANEIGTTIGGILNPDPDDEGFIEKVKNWVIGKIDDVFGGIDDVTLGDITGWITGTLGNVLGGLILIETENVKNSVTDKINDVLFGVAPTGDDENCIEIEYFEANKDECIALGYFDCSTVGREQTGGAKTRDDCEGCTETAEDGTPYEIKQTTGACEDPTTGDPALTEEEQDCIDKGRIFENGECTDNCDNPDYDVDPVDGSCGSRDITKNPEEICQEKGLTYDPNPNNPDRDNDGCVSPTVSDPKCDDPNAQNFGELGDCGECNANFKKDPNTGKCIPDETTGTDCSTITSENANKCGKTDCGDGVFVDKGKQCPGGTGCPEGQKKFDGENCEDVCPDDPSIPASDSACQSTTGCKPKGEVLESGCDGTTFFIRFADGECGEIYDSVPGYSGCGGGSECDDPNATVREDGSCGPCKAGYVFDGALERCVQESVPNPCNDATYAAANPQECGTGSECVDCTCAEYAAANPEECGTTPPPPPPSGGGGVGGGSTGSSGMFDLESFEIAGDPQLLARMEFPITNFLEGMFKDYV